MPVKIIREKLKVDETKIESEKFKYDLFLQGRLRWNILINLIVIALFLSPFLVPTIVTFILNAYFLLNWFVFMLIAIVKHIRINQTLNVFKRSDEENPKVIESKYKYIMATFVYKEPIELILKSLTNVIQIEGSEDCIMTVCLEERTPDLNNKIKQISNTFELSFKELIITVHPFGVLGEIPGKCSNSNYGIRSLYLHLKENNPNFTDQDYILTNFDVDTIFHKSYLNILKQAINKEKSVNKIVWQPLLYYNWNFDQLSFFTRIIGIFRSTLMAGALTTFNINVMSVFSASLKLYADGNFVHPFYQMDDIICYIRWLTLSKNSELKIKPIYCATLSGPTSGDTIWSELIEMIRQGQRWAIGSAEVFHYFLTKIRRINMLVAIIWTFNYLNYYAGFLCAQSLLFISTSISLTLSYFISDTSTTDNFDFRNLFMFFPVFLYAINLMMIILNKIAVNGFLKDLGVKENLGIFRQIFHFILTVPTQIFYSFIVFYGFFSIIIFGKKICKHGASNKENLKF